MVPHCKSTLVTEEKQLFLLLSASFSVSVYMLFLNFLLYNSLNWSGFWTFQRQGCRPSCPLMEQIVIPQVHLTLSDFLALFLSLSLSLAALFEKVKCVLLLPHICQRFSELQPSRSELSHPVRQLTGPPKGQCIFQRSLSLTHTHTHTCILEP